MKRLLLALLIASALAMSLAACMSVPVEQPLTQERALGSVTGSSVVITGTLTMSGTQMSGPVRYGLVSGAVVSGTTIAHGIGTTPTMALLTSSLPLTTPMFVSAKGPVSITVGISDSVSTSGVYWLAGR
jgi:hypothetical protein